MESPRSAAAGAIEASQYCAGGRVEDWGRDDEGLHIVMELIDGPNLYDLVQQGRLAVERVLHFTGQICRALPFVSWA